MTNIICLCRVHWQNPECPIHSKPRCEVFPCAEEGIWRSPGWSDVPMRVCPKHARSLLALGNEIQPSLPLEER